jgi:hypothetical protein
VVTFPIAPQHSGDTPSIDPVGAAATNLTAWIVVTGGDGVATVTLYNQGQITGQVDVDGQGIVQVVIPHPMSTVIDVYNPSPVDSGQTESIQVTYQACAGEWPEGVGTLTPTVTVTPTMPTATFTTSPTATATPRCQPTQTGSVTVSIHEDKPIASGYVEVGSTVTYWLTEMRSTAPVLFGISSAPPGVEGTSIVFSGSAILEQLNPYNAGTFEVVVINDDPAGNLEQVDLVYQICSSGWPDGAPTPTPTVTPTPPPVPN